MIYNRRFYILFALCSQVFIYTSIFCQSKNFIQYVNPFIGTGSIDSLSLSGSNFPGAVAPFGLVQLSPDTDANPEDPCSGYDFADDTIVGFSHTHLSGTGVADLFDFLFMPFRGAAKWNAKVNAKGELGYCSSFQHSNEKASPGYYSVTLDDAQMKVELTASEHCGIHQYWNQGKDTFSLMIDLNHSLDKKRPYWSCKIIDAQIRVVDKYTIEGYRVITGWANERRVYFYATFSHPILSTMTKAGSKVNFNQNIANHKDLKLIANFKTEPNTALVISVGLSSVSYEGAKQNLISEVGNKGFDIVKKQTEEKWNKELSLIDVEANAMQKEIFYTALYHCFIHPNTISDVNGDYINSNGEKCNMEGKKYYSTFSLWDTYRAAHPLYTLIQEKRTAEFINSMLVQYRDHGYLPIWALWGKETYCMIGNHAIPVIVDAYFKKIQNVDWDLAYEAIVKSSTVSHQNSAFNVLDKYHYLPENIESQSVSITLEIAFNDWCVAQMAKALNHESDFNFFNQRSSYYKNLFDTNIGFFRAKDDKGSWIQPFSPLKYGGNGGYPFTEGNAWQYLWYVPHDVSTFKEMMGGEKLFTKKLDEFFTLNAKPEDVNGNASGFIGQYAHGNEPSHHIAYLYNFTQEPWKSQYYSAKVLNELYSNTPSGYSGNEDCGQMSAWYILSAMGIYPVNPANGVYCFGSPQLQKASIHLANNKVFTVRAKNQNKSNVYIQNIFLNGKKYEKNYITHELIQQGGELEFTMGDQPNKKMSSYEKP